MNNVVYECYRERQTTTTTTATVTSLAPYTMCRRASNNNICTLPERQEDDGLDGEKLEDWVVRPEKIFSGKVEEKECIQCKADAQVVHQSDVQVTSFRPIIQRPHNDCVQVLHSTRQKINHFREVLPSRSLD